MIITKSSILDLDQSKIHFWQFVTLLQELFVMWYFSWILFCSLFLDIKYYFSVLLDLMCKLRAYKITNLQTT